MSSVADETSGDPIIGIETAVRNLVRLVRRHSTESSPGAGRILLDLQVDEVRCRLEAISPRLTPSGSLLSPRETEVARMVAQGYPNKTIAAELEISSFTVSSYLRRIFAKLGVNSRAAMVAQALENNLLPELFSRGESTGADSPDGDAS
jgi:DNA-binding NarL/FixJ family response regulator